MVLIWRIPLLLSPDIAEPDTETLVGVPVVIIKMRRFVGDVLRVNGFRFYMPPRDHSPSHVHVKKGDFATRLDISGKEACLMKGEKDKRQSGDAKLRKKAIQLANENLELLRRA